VGTPEERNDAPLTAHVGAARDTGGMSEGIATAHYRTQHEQIDFEGCEGWRLTTKE
jgi:hypothetical protein